MRFCVGLVLLVVAAGAGCTDEQLPSAPKMVPARLTIVPPSLGSTEFPLGSSQDPANSMSLPTYNDIVIVRFGVTGEFNVTSDPNTAVQPYAGPLDGSGIFVFGVWYNCYANITFSYSVQGRIGPGPCRSLPTPYFSWADTSYAQGQGTVTRAHGVPQYTSDCNYHPCHSYNGTQFVSVTPLPATLNLNASANQQPVGSTVSFTGSVTPFSMKNLQTPIKVLSWAWAPDAGGTGQTVPCATPVNPCSVAVKENGSMQLTALANGAEQVRFTRVVVAGVPCAAPALHVPHPKSSPFGDTTVHKPPHSGDDYAVSTGNDVFATTGGLVIRARMTGLAGNAVVTRSADGLLSYYDHLDSVNPNLVENQTVVSPGEFIGKSGHSGDVKSSHGGDGSHLHFEQHQGGPAYDKTTGVPPRETLIPPCTF
jgi:murein DD-endopeptidase MepM/ murein hydrolase activator NlpD